MHPRTKLCLHLGLDHVLIIIDSIISRYRVVNSRKSWDGRILEFFQFLGENSLLICVIFYCCRDFEFWAGSIQNFGDNEC